MSSKTSVMPSARSRGEGIVVMEGYELNNDRAPRDILNVATLDRATSPTSKVTRIVNVRI